jgi:hypothetical protein
MNRRRLLGLSASLLVSAGCTERTGRAPDSTPPATQTATTTTTKTTESPTRTPDCRIFDLSIYNDNVDTISVSLRIVQDEDASETGESNEIFSETLQIPPNNLHKYEDLPDSTGSHRLEIEVEDGPTATEDVQAHQWEQTSLIRVDIEEGSIEFRRVVQARPAGC